MDRVLSEQIAYLLEHPDDQRCRREVMKLLADRPDLMDQYVEQWRVHSLLQWSLEPAPVDSRRNSASENSAVSLGAAQQATPRSYAKYVRAMWAVAAALGLIAVGTFCFLSYAPIGKVIAAEDMAWADKSHSLTTGDSFRQGLLEATAGTCVLKFDSGVELACDGAFRLRVVNDMLVELEYGKLRAKVPQNARGFSVDTPDTLLVDQGTEFGVNTEAGEGTKVVVFRGEVDVSTKHLANGGATRRLFQGEAAKLVSGRESLGRVPQVFSGGPPTNWSANGHGGAWFSIRDNIRAADSLKYYNIVVGGLHDDVLSWVDRPHEWNGVTPDGFPEIVRGVDYAQTFNDDRYNLSFKMFVTVHQPAVLYVFIDNRIAALPDWLTKDFVDTDEDLGLDEGWVEFHQMESARGAGQSIDQTFSIWQRVIPEPTEIELGVIGAPGNFGMYGIAAKRLSDSNVRQ
jgi:ferric-dicitrate binding protein FerR (iron transport regulator)